MIIFEASTSGNKYKIVVLEGYGGFYDLCETVKDLIQKKSGGHRDLKEITRMVKVTIDMARDIDGINYKITKDLYGMERWIS